MKKSMLFIICFFLPLFLVGQTVSFQVDSLNLSGNPGDLIQFHGTITNNTGNPLSVRVVRMQNNLPANWTSSLCVELCFPPQQDTINIPGTFPLTNPFNPFESKDFYLDVTTGPNQPGDGTVIVRVENMNNPSDYVELTFFATTNPTGIIKRNLPVSGNFQLYPNYPNPFNPETNISFEVGGFQSVPTQLILYNVLGQQIAVLVNEVLTPGAYTVTWDGRNSLGKPVTSGMYFYQLSAGNFRMMNKMILMK